MTLESLHRQVGSLGPVLCHYAIPQVEFGYMLSRTTYGVLFTFGGRGHAFAVGWMTR